MISTAYIILGSNKGDKIEYINKAITEISSVVGEVIAQSSNYQTSPWGFESESEFVNKVICVKTKLEPSSLMRSLLQIENNLGRERDASTNEYQSRTIDLDVLIIDDLVIFTELLQVPHPRMSERKFVLVPLNEIAPNLNHPERKMTIANLLEICSDNESVTKIVN